MAKTKTKTNKKKDLMSVPAEDIQSLASTIIAEREEERILEEEKLLEPVIKVARETNTLSSEFVEVTEPTETIYIEPVKVILPAGNTIIDAVHIEKHEREVAAFLEQVFGRENGSYFILGDITQWRTYNGTQRKYKVVKIEDKQGFRYNIWFDVSNISLLT